MNSCISNEQKTVIPLLFKTMNESPASPSRNSLAENWLETCDAFTGFVDGKWLPLVTSEDETVDIELTAGVKATVKWASSDEIVSVVENSKEGFERWRQYEAEAKSKVLYRISQYIEQSKKLFNAIDSLTKYGRLREKYNVEYLIDSFIYYAGLISNRELSEGSKPTGVVGVVCNNDTWVSSLWVLSGVLAAGNSIIFLVDCRQNLSAFLLAQLCDSAGLPAGVFNVISCQDSSLSMLPCFDKIILSSLQSQVFSPGALNKYIPCEIIPYQWPCLVIYESADLDAAISNVLEMLLIFDAKGPFPLCKIYLQESIKKKFIQLLSLKICGSFGNNTDCTPSFYIMGSEVTVAQVLDILLSGDSSKKIFNACKSAIKEDSQWFPSAVINFNSNHDQDQSIRKGPGICIEQFRTVEESIAMLNLNKKNCSVSIWSEDIYLSLEAASKFKSRTVWVNCQNIFEPSITQGSLYLSGNSNIGGKEGFFSHLSCLGKDKDTIKKIDCNKIQSYGSQAPSSSIIPLNNEGKSKCIKLFIGGAFVNSNGETFMQIFDENNEPYAFVPSANKSDIDKAVLSASSSQLKWGNMLKIKRASVIRQSSEILNKRREEFVSELCSVTGVTKEFCSKEVELAVFVLLQWANHIDDFNGQIVESKVYGKVFQEYPPLGIIGIQCPDTEPLLSFVSLITPAIIFGNAVVAISSEKYPTCALKMCEVFQAAGLLGGVLNVVSSSRPYLTRHLSCHLNVDSIWFSEDGANFIYDSYHSIQPKKIFCCKNMVNNLDKTKMSKFFMESTYSKATFVPMGTGFTK